MLLIAALMAIFTALFVTSLGRTRPMYTVGFGLLALACVGWTVAAVIAGQEPSPSRRPSWEPPEYWSRSPGEPAARDDDPPIAGREPAPAPTEPADDDELAAADPEDVTDLGPASAGWAMALPARTTDDVAVAVGADGRVGVAVAFAASDVGVSPLGAGPAAPVDGDEPRFAVVVGGPAAPPTVGIGAGLTTVRGAAFVGDALVLGVGGAARVRWAGRAVRLPPRTLAVRVEPAGVKPLAAAPLDDGRVVGAVGDVLVVAGRHEARPRLIGARGRAVAWQVDADADTVDLVAAQASGDQLVACLVARGPTLRLGGAPAMALADAAPQEVAAWIDGAGGAVVATQPLGAAGSQPCAGFTAARGGATRLTRGAHLLEAIAATGARTPLVARFSLFELIGVSSDGAGAIAVVSHERRAAVRVVDVTRDAVRWRYRLPEGVRVDRALLAGTTVVLLGRYRGAVTLAADVALPATDDTTAFVATFTVP